MADNEETVVLTYKTIVLLFFVINVKKTTVYTHVNGDRPSHIENSKSKKKLYYYITAHRRTSMCSSIVK